jgi:hypothetical protein
VFPTKVLVTVNGSDGAKLAARVAADPAGTFGSSMSVERPRRPKAVQAEQEILGGASPPGSREAWNRTTHKSHPP